MRGESYPRMIDYWIWGGAFVTTALLLVVLGRVAYRAIQTSQTSTKFIVAKDGKTASSPG
jgi:hypothetical protein